MNRRLIPLSIIAFLTVAAGAEGSAQIALFLERTHQPSEASALIFDKIVLSSEQIALELDLIQSRVSGEDLSRQQVLLAESDIEPGAYHQLVLNFSVELASGAPSDTSAPSSQHEVVIPVNIVQKANTTAALFLAWRQESPVDSSSPGRHLFHPVQKNLPPRTSLAFVSNEGSGYLTVVDRKAGDVVACLRVGNSPRGLALAPLRGLLFVANSQSNTISVIELSTLQFRDDVHLDPGDEPEVLCLSTEEKRLFVANRGSSSVTAIDIQTMTVQAKINVGSAPQDIAVDPATQRIWVANSLSDNISIFDPVLSSQMLTVEVGSLPSSIEFDQRRNLAYVANYHSGFVTQVSSTQLSVTGQVSATRFIRDLKYDPLADILYGAVENLDYVAVFKPSLNIELSEIQVPASPRHLALDPEGSFLYVCCAKSNNLAVINRTSGQVERTVAAGRNPFMVVFP